MNRLAPLKSLYSFVAVVETGSMTNAANLLNVSHSAVSQAIKSLEEQLDLPLFHRVGRHVTLTANGKQYYKQIAPALEQIVLATQQMIEKRHSHRLTLNMINSLAMHWWIPRVHSFNQFAPNIDVRISTLIDHFVLEQEGVDVALVHGTSEPWQEYYCELLGHDELVLVCNPDLLEPDAALDIRQLLSHYPAIIVTNERRQHDWQIWCDAHQLPLPQSGHNLSFTASVQAVQATIRKLGVFVTHRLFVRDDIKLGLLTEVGAPVANPYQDFYFVCQKEKLQNEHVLQLRTWLRSEFSLSER